MATGISEILAGTLSGSEDIFNDYVISRIMEKSALFRSGVVTPVNALVPGSGRFAHFPYFNELSGDAELLTDDGSLTVNNITAGDQVAAILARGKAFGVNDLANLVTGEDPLRALAGLVGDYWVRQYDRAIIKTLDGSAEGVDAGIGAGTIINDESAASITATMAYDTMQLMGEYSTDINTVVMHSAVYNELNKQDLIATEFPSANMPVTSYLGRQVVVDDLVTNGAGVYNTYFCKSGAVGFADGTPSELAVEFDRDILAGDNMMTTRRRFVVHPQGASWQAAGAANAIGYDNTALGTAGNWTNAFADANKFGVRVLKHLL